MPGFIGESALKSEKVDRGPFKCQRVYCLAAEKSDPFLRFLIWRLPQSLGEGKPNFSVLPSFLPIVK